MVVLGFKVGFEGGGFNVQWGQEIWDCVRLGVDMVQLKRVNELKSILGKQLECSLERKRYGK